MSRKNKIFIRNGATFFGNLSNPRFQPANRESSAPKNRDPKPIFYRNLLCERCLRPALSAVVLAGLRAAAALANAVAIKMGHFRKIGLGIVADWASRVS